MSRFVAKLIVALTIFVPMYPLAAAPSGKPIDVGTQYEVRSKFNDRIYRLYVRIPTVPPPASGYPIVYVLDGNLQFQTAAGIALLRAWSNEMPHAVVVGIGYPDGEVSDILRWRWSDLSLPASIDQLPPRARELKPELGGLDRFLRFLDEEAKPFAEGLVPVNTSCRTLFGHSLAGLAVLHELFAKPGSFQAYVAASPAIWWANRKVLEKEADFLGRVQRGEVKARLLLTAGGLEEDTTPWLAMPEIAQRVVRNRQVRNVTELAERLSSRQTDGFKVTSKVFPDETHTSVVPTSISRGLHFGLQCPAS